MSKHDGSALMFDEEEVRSTSEFLPRLIRVIFFGLSISNDDYLYKYYQYFRDVNPSKSKKEFSQEAASNRKFILQRKKLTFNLMRRILSAMGYDIECVSIRLKDRVTGDIRVFSTDDTIEDLQKIISKEKEIGVQRL